MNKFAVLHSKPRYTLVEEIGDEISTVGKPIPLISLCKVSQSERLNSDDGI